MNGLYRQIEENMDALADKHVWWSNCATGEQIENAKRGKLELPLGIGKPAPRGWIGNLAGKNVLCLAGAGGLQAPLLASAGANVTVIDISRKMLNNDAQMAEKYGLNIRIEHGNMIDLSRFENEIFDLIINPASLFYVPDVCTVFKQCYRVLKTGGVLILAAPNPIAYVCDYIETEEGGYYKAVNRMPYSSLEHQSDSNWVEFGHTMEDYIGGQIACGFVITGYIEDQQDDITDLYFMTKAVKLPSI